MEATGWRELKHPFTVITGPQKPGISPKCKEVKTPAGSLGPLLHPIPVFPLTCPCSRRNPPHLNPYSLQPSLWAPSGGPGWTDPHRLPHRTRSAGRPRGKDLRAHLLKDFPSGLPALLPRALTPRQPAYSLASPKLGTGGPVWPGMSPSRFVDAQSVPSQTPHHLPAGKLVPLPHSTSPWSHVGVDFVTDLPKSEGYTCILVAVDRFSKACKLIPPPSGYPRP